MVAKVAPVEASSTVSSKYQMFFALAFRSKTPVISTMTLSKASFHVGNAIILFPTVKSNNSAASFGTNAPR